MLCGRVHTRWEQSRPRQSGMRCAGANGWRSTHLCRVLVSTVVEGGRAFHAEGHLATETLDFSDQPRERCSVLRPAPVRSLWDEQVGHDGDAIVG